MADFNGLKAKYFYYFFSTKFYERAMSMTAKATVDSVRLEMISDMNIKYPENEVEQQKISSLLTNIDNLITLHQRKCIYDLQDWEQRKYNDLGIPLSGGNLSYDSLNDNGDKKCVLYGDLYTKYDCIINNIKNKTFEVGNSIIKNDILFPQSTTVDAYSLISPACLNEEKAETSGVFVIRPYDNINGNFICYYTKGNIEQRKKLAKKAQGLTIVHLYYHSIKDETIMIPTKNEQDKISNILLNIDNLITLHQQK